MRHHERSIPLAATVGRRRTHAPALALALLLLALGAQAALPLPASATETCVSGVRDDSARVQLWSSSGCKDDTVTVALTDKAPDRPDFTSFGGTWFDGKASSLAVAAGSCVRLFADKNFAGASHPIVCAPSATQYVAELGGFDNDASSLRVCSVQIPSDCDAPKATPAPGSPAPPPAATPPTCAAAPTVPGLRLRAGGRRGVMTTRAKRSPVITGRLTHADGTPLVGASLCVETKGTVPGAQPAVAGTVTSGPDGRFFYRLPAGASKRVTFAYRGAEGTASYNVLVRVRAPVSMRASSRTLRNGQILGLRGWGPRGTGRGLLVEIQAKRPTGWQTFATTRTRRRGAFRFRYQFTRTLGVTVYKLRARVPFQPTLPFAPGASRTVRVRVAG